MRGRFGTQTSICAYGEEEGYSLLFEGVVDVFPSRTGLTNEITVLLCGSTHTNDTMRERRAKVEIGDEPCISRILFMPDMSRQILPDGY